MIARCLLLTGASFVACLPCASAQLPKRLEKCLPYPTLAQEIKAAQPAEPARTQVKVHVVRVEFDPNDGIPADAQEEISIELQKQVFELDAHSAYLNNEASSIADVGVRERLRVRGYFKATATAKLSPLGSQAADTYVVAAIRAALGPQYRAGDIRVESADPETPLRLSPESLRMLIPLQSGELFSTERVRTGLESLARAYGREGYVDMTAEPETMVDDARETIDLVIRIDQPAQYRVANVEFLGVSPVTQETLLQSLPKAGEVFDTSRLNEFFKVNKTLLPADASRDDVSVRRDNKARTVAISFDFRTCHSNSN